MVLVEVNVIFYVSEKVILPLFSVTDNEIVDFIERALETKRASHGGMEHLVRTRDQNRPMTSIGG